MLERERECGELPSPICPGLIPLAELSRDLLFLRLAENIQRSTFKHSTFNIEAMKTPNIPLDVRR